MAQHESLAGGLVGLWAALSAGLLAYWSIQEQIEEGRLTVRRQIEADHQEQGESTAKSIFREYLRLAFEHPDLAEPDYPKLAAEPDKYKKYSWFVAHLLWACEEILQYEKGEIWKKNLQTNVDYHREYFINDSDFKEKDFPLYDPSVQELVRSAMTSRTKNRPPPLELSPLPLRLSTRARRAVAAFAKSWRRE
jgi:hypothetical protein